MNKDVDFIARGLILDNAIDDMIKELSVSPFNVIHSNEIYKDYKHYKATANWEVEGMERTF